MAFVNGDSTLRVYSLVDLTTSPNYYDFTNFGLALDGTGDAPTATYFGITQTAFSYNSFFTTTTFQPAGAAVGTDEKGPYIEIGFTLLDDAGATVVTIDPENPPADIRISSDGYDIDSVGIGVYVDGVWEELGSLTAEVASPTFLSAPIALTALAPPPIPVDPCAPFWMAFNQTFESELCPPVSTSFNVVGLWSDSPFLITSAYTGPSSIPTLKALSLGVGFVDITGIKEDGTFFGLGSGTPILDNPPPPEENTLVALFSADREGVAGREDGTLLTYGAPEFASQLVLPTLTAPAKKIIIGSDDDLVLTADTSFEVYVLQDNGEIKVPDGVLGSWPTGNNYVDIYRAGPGIMALTAEGTVEIWGQIGNAILYPPAGLSDVVQLRGDAQGRRYIALQSTGVAVKWGYNSGFDIPAGLQANIAAVGIDAAASWLTADANGTVTVTLSQEFGTIATAVDGSPAVDAFESGFAIVAGIVYV